MFTITLAANTSIGPRDGRTYEPGDRVQPVWTGLFDTMPSPLDLNDWLHGTRPDSRGRYLPNGSRVSSAVRIDVLRGDVVFVEGPTRYRALAVDKTARAAALTDGFRDVDYPTALLNSIPTKSV